MVLITKGQKTAHGIKWPQCPVKYIHFLLLCCLTLILQACAPAKLTNVLVDDRLANPNEYSRVQIFHKDKSMVTTKDMQLQKDSIIETDEQSWAVIRFSSGARVILKPGTIVRISSLTLIKGSVLAVIDKLQGLFSVKTEDAEAGPRSTIFSATKTENGPTVVSVIRGKVKLSSPSNSWQPLLIQQYQEASTSTSEPPKLYTMNVGDYNEIVDWGNRVERAINPSKARVIVPNIQSLHKSEAETLIESVGLRPGKVTSKITAGGPPVGTVLEQYPAPGTWVPRGSLIEIAVEVKPVQLPQLINKPLPLAREILLQNDLNLGKIDRRITGKAPAETVINQTPVSGSVVPQGSAVDLVVEEESVVVPDVRRFNKDQASIALRNTNLVIEKWEEQITGSQPPQTVIRQDPGPNERVRPGTGVTLVVEAVSVIVPNIVGYQRKNAAEILSRNELGQGQVVEIITGQQPAGAILSQEPAAGQRVKRGSPVRMQVEAVSAVVPNLARLSRDAAINTLQQNNLQIGQVLKELRDDAPNAIVLNQSIPTGQRVALQTPIDITIAVRGIRIPDFRRQNQKNVIALLDKYRLQTGRIESRESSRKDWDKVIGQSPLPGTLVHFNSSVNLVVGKRPECYVPNVVGMNVVEAGEAIRAARLVPYNTNKAAGTKARVRSQNPAPRVRLNCGATVRYQGYLRLQPDAPLMRDTKDFRIKQPQSYPQPEQTPVK